MNTRKHAGSVTSFLAAVTLIKITVIQTVSMLIPDRTGHRHEALACQRIAALTELGWLPRRARVSSLAPQRKSGVTPRGLWRS